MHTQGIQAAACRCNDVISDVLVQIEIVNPLDSQSSLTPCVPGLCVYKGLTLISLCPPQLSGTKSLDRKQTLLHYIAHVVESVYPNVLSFHEELNIEKACQGR